MAEAQAAKVPKRKETVVPADDTREDDGATASTKEVGEMRGELLATILLYSTYLVMWLLITDHKERTQVCSGGSKGS